MVVGTTDTGEAGTAAVVTNSGTPSNVVLDFIIPRGETGATGATGPTGANGADAVFTPAAPVTDATDEADVVIKFNNLLANLRAAGLLST
jgi:hypothetical protein